MELENINEIIACLPQSRTLFYYFRDRYCLLLPSLCCRLGIDAPFAERFRERAIVKERMAAFGTKKLTSQHYQWLEHDRQHDSRAFLLSLSHWDGRKPWGQTTRPGYNLVLQLGLGGDHAQVYERLAKPDGVANLAIQSHPVMGRKQAQMPNLRFRETLAWSRIDLDFQTGEALIEEVQSDWLRNVTDLRRLILQNQKMHLTFDVSSYGFSTNSDKILQYCEWFIKTYADIWAEAMLMATIQFLVEELGIMHIYYHSYETGKKLKKCNPPWSLYTQLPKRFGFVMQDQLPLFLQQNRWVIKTLRKIEHPQWFYLGLVKTQQQKMA